MSDNPFRVLRAADEVLDTEPIRSLADAHAHDMIVDAIRAELSELRQRLAGGEALDGATAADHVGIRVVARVTQSTQPKLRTVINATGIVLHTNLGRAPIAEEAARAAYAAARGYLNLELDLETGKRSSRQIAIRDWFCRLTGAQSATAATNTAPPTVTRPPPFTQD